jgi:hypothetical protein
MIRALPEDVVRPPANVVAQLVLQCMRDDPTLVKRSRGHARTEPTQAIQPPVTRPELRSPPIVLSDADPAIKQYFEDLVSIAVASSERADDLLREAYDASRKATHATWAFASIAAVSVLVGVAGMVGSHHGNAADTHLAEIAGGVKSLDRQQQPAGQQFAAARPEIADERPGIADERPGVADERPGVADQRTGVADQRTGVADERSAAVTAQQAVYAPPANTQGAIPGETTPVATIPVATTPMAAIPVATLPATAAPPTQPFGATPAGPVQQATYSPPWPAYHHPRRPTPTVVQRRRIPVPRFLFVFQQNLQTLFR